MRDARRNLRRTGFSLVEVMITVSIIGLLAVLAVPAVRKSRRASQNTAFVNDLRVLSGHVIEFYATQRGDFPPDAAPGVLPDEFSDYLRKGFDWSEATPIGGRWDWDRAADRGTKIYGCYAGLSVFLPNRTTPEMQEIDRMIDDGDLLTGTFRSKPKGYVFIIEP